MRLFSLILLITIANLSIAQEQLTNEDIWGSAKFRNEYVYGLRSMNDGIHYTSLDDSRGAQVITKNSYKTGQAVGAIVQSSDLMIEGQDNPIKIDDYTFSSDENKLLIATETEPIYRHSTRETNYVYDIKTKKLNLLAAGDKQRYASFSPNANQVAYVRGNNIFIQDITKKTEIQVTNDGEKNKIINGATDWVYEEEFAFAKAFFWSPDGKYIAYYRFDEGEVREFNMAMYGSLYPEDYKYKYPKAGEKNSKVEIYIFSLEGQSKAKVDVNSYEYIPRIKWTNNNELVVFTMNRHQNQLNLWMATPTTGQVKPLLEEKSETYIDIDDDLTFLKDGTGFIWTSEKSGYNHLYYYSYQGTNEKQLTSGKWDVTAYNGMDEKKKIIYYESSEESPMERHLYSIKIDGSGKQKLTDKAGWNTANFSNGMKYYINYHSSITSPYYITLHLNSGKLIRNLKTNENLQKTLDEYKLNKAEFFTLKVNSTELNAWMIKPADFDENKKYPVLMYVYGGPGSQTVKNSWGGGNYLWHQLLAQKGYVVVSIDNRGTGARGEDFKKITYKQLGKYETQDQIACAQKLGDMPFIDKSRIGIWGWSYGGYMSSLCLFKGHKTFKSAIAVAPVSNWRYYDSIYTERYMQTPQENADGYDSNSPINHVDSLQGNYLLVHGTADDNVHYQNTIELSNALINSNKQFDLMVYPNKNHGIYGGFTRLHLFTKMTEFILENL